MSRNYKFHNLEGVYFVTLTVQAWVDMFTRNLYKNLIIENLQYCQEHKGLKIYAWVLMTNHLHLIIRSEGNCTLPDILRDFKKHTSKAIRKTIEENPRESRKEWLLEQFHTKEGWRFWRGDNKPIELWSNHVIDQKINYIHMNPVKGGFVFKQEEYMYSSAIDYAGGKGMLEVEVVY